ncbi:MAG: tryptophan synthase subunit alpha [Candidatus Methylacidiphilales bacterium]
MNRIDSTFQTLRASGRKALVAYLVAGDPDLDTTVELILELEAAGADLIELGLPFSDPLADGLVNQLGAQRALNAGATLDKIFQMIRTVRARTEVPLVLFTYFNPVFRLGVDRFSSQAVDAGVDGILVLDLPPEEVAREWIFPDSLRRIALIAPTTPPERIASICKHSSGFIYYVSREGVTGMQEALPPDIARPLAAIKAHTDVPVCVGFGISNPQQAAAVARFADGVVVGSAIVHRIGEKGRSSELLHTIHSFVRPLADAVHQAGVPS